MPRRLASFIWSLGIALAIVPALSAQQVGCPPEHLADLEFWVGAWEGIDSDGRVAGRDSVAVVLDGCALHETWIGNGGHRGHSYTTYHRPSQQWHQTWVDNAGTFLHLSGGPTSAGTIRLEGTVTGRDGKPVRSRITWSRCPAGCSLTQRWEISRDDGMTWQAFSDLRYRPAAPCLTACGVDDRTGVPVGFTTHWIETPESERPLRLLVWYPGTSGGESLTFGNYLDIAAATGRGPWGASLRERELETARKQFSPASDSLWHILAARPVAARRDMVVAPGEHPVILHLLGLGNWSLESTVMWEQLAAAGYVVVVVSQLPIQPEEGFRFGTPMIHQLRDDALRGIKALPVVEGADPRRIVVAGHSIGGLVGLLLAAQVPEIEAVISLDGSASTRDGVAALDSLEWSAGQIRVPVLDVYRNANPMRDRSLMQRIDPQLLTSVMIGGVRPPEIVTHFDFQNWPLYSTWLGVADPRGEPARPASSGALAYQAVIGIVRAWLSGSMNQAAIQGWLAEHAPHEVPITMVDRQE